MYAECTCGRGGESYALCAMLSFECSILNYYGLNKICLANNVDKAASRHNIQASLRGRVKTPNINSKKLVVRSCVDVQRVFVFLQKRAL